MLSRALRALRRLALRQAFGQERHPEEEARHVRAVFCENNATKRHLWRRYVRREIATHARLRHGCVVQMMRFFEDGAVAGGWGVSFGS